MTDEPTKELDQLTEHAFKLSEICGNDKNMVQLLGAMLIAATINDVGEMIAARLDRLIGVTGRQT